MLDALQLDRFVGIPYCPRHMDCADLALLVQRELFGRRWCWPASACGRSSWTPRQQPLPAIAPSWARP
jgi:hypothetical protein